MFVLLLISCAGAPEQESRFAAGPEWIYAPDTVYPEAQYLSAVGYGSDRESAEKNALGALTAVFGQSVRGETRAGYRYSEAVADGIIDMRENSEIDSAVKTSFAQDTLIGAEIKDAWFDGTTHYAVAVMDKLKCGILYSDLIEANQRTIAGLISFAEGERQSFEGYARYELAAAVADANTAFANILSVISPASAALLRDELRGGDEFRLEGRSILQRIPIAVTVEGDAAGRIKSAFSQVIADRGFLSGGGGSRYSLEGSLLLEDVELPQNPNKFVRYTVNAVLMDTVNGSVLFPYSVSGREGHVSPSEAENRALRAAESSIREFYGQALENYLLRISPKIK
jgi:hypothetical protein